MEVGDSLKDFFVKKIIAPRVLRLDIPGYISGKFYTIEGQNAFVRSIFIPETFFLNLEQLTKTKLGEEGVLQLYIASKLFGYNFTNLNRIPRGNVGLSLDLITKFMEVLYAEKLELKVDAKRKYVELMAKELFITRLNGHGESLTIGGYAGVCSYVFNDFNNIECGIMKVGDDYKFICGDNDSLQKAKVKHFSASGNPPTFDAKYAQFNTPSGKPDPTKFSLNKFLQGNLFTYEKGHLKFSLAQIRFAPVELSLSYLLNQHIPDEIIYESAKLTYIDIGQKTGKQQNPHTFLANLLTALGYGIVTVGKRGTTTLFELVGYPWYYGCESSKLPMLKGIIEGFLESQEVTNKTVNSIKTRMAPTALLVSVEI